MAVPKQKTSKSRKGKRRTHQGLAAPNIPKSRKERAPSSRAKRFFCQVCEQPKPPHSVCPNCGSYKGRQVIETEA